MMSEVSLKGSCIFVVGTRIILFVSFCESTKGFGSGEQTAAAALLRFIRYQVLFTVGVGIYVAWLLVFYPFPIL